VSPPCQPTTSTEYRGHPIKRRSIIVAEAQKSRSKIAMVLVCLLLKLIQAPAIDDVQHANAERSVERLLLEQKGWKV